MKTVTIHNLNQSTAQEVYDFVSNHLLDQKERAVGKIPPQGAILGDEGPVYRILHCDGKVLMCSGGCLIPEEDYRVEMEGMAWEDLIKTNYVKTSEHSHLIKNLQVIHDAIPVEDWPKKLLWLGEAFKLNLSFVRQKINQAA